MSTLSARDLNASHIGKRIIFDAPSGAVVEDVLITVLATSESVVIEVATVSPVNSLMMRGLLANGFMLAHDLELEVHA